MPLILSNRALRDIFTSVSYLTSVRNYTTRLLKRKDGKAILEEQMSYVISTDTSANLPDAMIEQNDLVLIPFSYIENGEEKQCLKLEEFDAESYYRSIRGKVPHTSMINIDQYLNAWEPLLKEGKDVLHISMSSGISGAYNASVAAAEQLYETYPERTIITVDTRAASLGEGLQVLKACEMKKSGASIEEVEKYLLALRTHMKQIFTVDDLMHLKRGGRLSGGIALLGTVLHIKPVLIGNELGQIIAVDKVRGKKAALTELFKDYEKKVADPAKDLVGIAHCGCAADAKALSDDIQRCHPEQQVLIVDYEPVTGCHVGPGAVALFFFRDIAKETEEHK